MLSVWDVAGVVQLPTINFLAPAYGYGAFKCWMSRVTWWWAPKSRNHWDLDDTVGGYRLWVGYAMKVWDWETMNHVLRHLEEPMVLDKKDFHTEDEEHCNL